MVSSNAIEFNLPANNICFPHFVPHHLRDRLFCCDWSSCKKSRVKCCGEVPYNNPRFECIHRCIKVLIVAMS